MSRHRARKNTFPLRIDSLSAFGIKWSNVLYCWTVVPQHVLSFELLYINMYCLLNCCTSACTVFCVFWTVVPQHVLLYLSSLPPSHPSPSILNLLLAISTPTSSHPWSLSLSPAPFHSPPLFAPYHLVLRHSIVLDLWKDQVWKCDIWYMTICIFILIPCLLLRHTIFWSQ